MDHKELFKQMKSGKTPISIHNIKIISDPVLKALGVEQKNIEVYDFKAEKFHNEEGNIVSMDQMGYKYKVCGMNQIGYLLQRENSKLQDAKQRKCSIFIDITNKEYVKRDTINIISIYGHEIAHATQYNGSDASSDVLEKTKNELNDQAGKEFFNDTAFIELVVEEYIARWFEREFGIEFFNQYHHKFNRGDWLKFNPKVRLVDMLKYPHIVEDETILCQFLGKNFLDLETLPQYQTIA